LFLFLFFFFSFFPHWTSPTKNEANCGVGANTICAVVAVVNDLTPAHGFMKIGTSSQAFDHERLNSAVKIEEQSPGFPRRPLAQRKPFRHDFSD